MHRPRSEKHWDRGPSAHPPTSIDGDPKHPTMTRRSSYSNNAKLMLPLLCLCAMGASAFVLRSSSGRGLVRMSTVSSKVPTAAPKANSESGAKRGPKAPIIAPIFKDVCELQGITLTRFMLEVSRANPHLSEIESLMNSIQTASKTIRSLVEVSALRTLLPPFDAPKCFFFRGLIRCL